MENPFSGCLDKMMAIPKFDFKDFPFFIKGDISGIQDFIFNVKSEGAAKVLKGRSFFIQVLAEVAVYIITEELGSANCQIMFNSGGNFYLLSKVEPDFTGLRKKINEDLADESLYLYLGYIKMDILNFNFGAERSRLEMQMQLQKLRSFADFPSAFKSFPEKGDKHWKKFTEKFVRSQGAIITKSILVKAVEKDGVKLLGTEYKLSNSTVQFAGRIINYLPFWEAQNSIPKWREQESIQKLLRAKKEDEKDRLIPNSIIEFTELAAFAEARTGTPRLGVLKFDIDNLGKLFEGIKDSEKGRKISVALQWFFDNYMYQLMHETFEPIGSGNEPGESLPTFGENIYVVFSGGDDGFVLGAWDAVFSFADRLQTEFTDFIQFLSKQVGGISKLPTLSAGLIVVGPKFPVIQFAKEAEKALEDAKSWREEKNLISVFGEVLTWEEYRKAENMAAFLSESIKEGELSRAILERIKRSAIGYEKLRRSAQQGRLRAPKVWRLFYFLGKRKEPKSPAAQRRQEKVSTIIQEYATGLMNAFHGQREALSHMVFPVAARWAEFLTKAKSQNNQ
jgi:CRISPR-associated protein Csm1